MKIRELLFASALLLTASFCSCNENEVVTPSRGEQTQSIAFSISIPKGDPVTYVIHDEPEWTIESLWLLEFEPNVANMDESKLLKKKEILSSELNKTNAPEYTYNHSITDADRGTRVFIFLANEAVPAGIDAGSTLGDLKAKLASKELSTNSSELLNTIGGKNVIPMTGTATHTAGSSNPIIVITKHPAAVHVDLERIVARIDIINRAKNLEIKKFTLQKTNKQSHLLLNGDYKVPGTNTKVNDIKAFAVNPVPAIATPTTSQPEVSYAKSFYLYEGHQPADKKDAVHIQIEGEVGGIPVVYSIPFWNEKDDKEVPVKRNHIYRVILGEATLPPIVLGTTVTFKIEDTDWTEITMHEDFDIILGTPSSSLPSGVSYDAVRHELSVPQAGFASLTFDFTTEFEGHTDFIADTGSSGWIEASFIGKVLTIKVAANASGKKRSGVIKVHSNVDPTTIFSINVKQEK